MFGIPAELDSDFVVLLFCGFSSAQAVVTQVAYRLHGVDTNNRLKKEQNSSLQVEGEVDGRDHSEGTDNT